MLKTLKSLLPNPLKKWMKRPYKAALSSMVDLDREFLSRIYLKGKGLEVGALHNPLVVGKQAKVSYVDRYSNADLVTHYPDLSSSGLVDVDIIDDGECLNTVLDGSQDFVIANHFIEHCQNPIKAIHNMCRVLKPNGVLYIALPDKRYTFDVDRPVTPFEHILKDYREGPEQSKVDHFKEWVGAVSKIHNPVEAEKAVQEIMEKDYSIHFHVWTQTEMLEMFVMLIKHFQLSLNVEVCLKQHQEFIMLLRKVS